MARRLFLLVVLACLGAGHLAAEGVRKTVAFPRGLKTVTLAGSLAAGDTDRYELAGNENQTLTVRVTAKEKDVAAILYLPGYTLPEPGSQAPLEGLTLEGAGKDDKAATWTGQLPISGTYLIEVAGPGGSAGYKLTVTLR